jgi:hypothetical protein
MSEEVSGEVSPSTSSERDWASEASSMGWNPEYDGPDKLDPREFVLRKPLYDEQRKLKRKVKELETTIRTQSQIQEQLIIKEREEAIQKLKQEKRSAVEEGDGGKVIEIDEELERIKSQPVQKAGPSQEFIEWSSDPNNAWYGEDNTMTLWADAYGARAAQANPGRNVSDIFAEITREVRKAFPHRFKNPNREKTNSVSSGETRQSSQKVELGENSIPSDYKQVFHTMWRSGAWGDMTKKDAAKKYAADLVKIGVISEKD